MIMAFAATERRSHPSSTNCANALGSIFSEVFLRLCAAFTSHHVETIKARRDELLRGWLGQ